MQIWSMCTVFVIVMHFMPSLNITDFFRTAEYQPEPCLLDFTSRCEVHVHFQAFALRPSRKFVKISMKKKALFTLYSTVHVVGREELQLVFLFPKREYVEHCMQNACAVCSSRRSADWFFHLRRRFLHDSCTYDFCRRNCSNFWRTCL